MDKKQRTYQQDYYIKFNIIFFFNNIPKYWKKDNTIYHKICSQSNKRDIKPGEQALPDEPGVDQLIAEADGGMVPIVVIDNDPKVKDK